MVDQTNSVFEDSTEVQKDLLNELVGDGKKFKTPEDLARGKVAADIHIAKLEKENAEYREKLTKASSVDDILAAVKANAATVQNQTATQTQEDEHRSAPASISAEQVAKIVAEQLTGHETARQKEQNRKKANDLMVGMFGGKAKDVFEKEANSPELRAILTQLAEVNPEKFALFFKREAPKDSVDAGGNVRTVNLLDRTQGGEPEAGTEKFYLQMRRKDPKNYWSSKTQLEMVNAALANPDKYFGESL